ncbi:Chitinase 1 [Spathaspora sp. JA1]|nr:Chitinase 1 [Spathaspora sp. JA1]
MNGFPNLELNFANQCSDSFSNGVLHCSQIGADIKSCQSQGKIILLSLGGATGTYGFSSDSDGAAFATILWNKFGGGSDSERPFDDAIVDGFDFDMENKLQTGYVSLANQLRQYFNSDTSKTYYLSAAPQCPYPDESVGDLLSQCSIDFAFIQFYNNYCSLGGSFNWDTWSQYAKTTSPNKNIKLYLGLPGSTASAGSGYADLGAVANALATIKGDPSFGGISIWDVSSAENDGFLSGIAGALGSNTGGSPVSPAPVASSEPSSVEPSSVPTSQWIPAYSQASEQLPVPGTTEAPEQPEGTTTMTTLQTIYSTSSTPRLHQHVVHKVYVTLTTTVLVPPPTATKKPIMATAISSNSSPPSVPEKQLAFQYANECDLEIHCSPFGLSGLYIKINGTNLMGIGSTMGLITGSTKGLIHYNDSSDLIDQKYKLYVIVDDEGMLRIDFTKIFTTPKEGDGKDKSRKIKKEEVEEKAEENGYIQEESPTLIFRGKCPEGRPDGIEPFIGIFSFEKEN